MFRVNYQAGGRMDPPFMPTKTMPYFKGRYLEIPSEPGEWGDTFKLDFDAELIGFAIEVNPIEREDYWELFVNDNPVMESIHVKLLPQGMYFIAFIPIVENSEIRFVYHNIKPTVTKVVTLDLQFLRD